MSAYVVYAPLSVVFCYIQPVSVADIGSTLVRVHSDAGKQDGHSKWLSGPETLASQVPRSAWVGQATHARCPPGAHVGSAALCSPPSSLRWLQQAQASCANLAPFLLAVCLLLPLTGGPQQTPLAPHRPASHPTPIPAATAMAVWGGGAPEESGDGGRGC